MIRNGKFWISLAVFQLVFGFVVFSVTRDYYQQQSPGIRAHPSTLSPSANAWQGIAQSDILSLAPGAAAGTAPQDPELISRQANEFFSNRQYQQAAQAYEQLLSFDPNNVDVLNNLGLTLHYLGRSDEALRHLNNGVTLDASNQRIWLTLGYVNSQLGNIEPSRTALTNATEVGSNESIRQSALRMLDELP